MRYLLVILVALVPYTHATTRSCNCGYRITTNDLPGFSKLSFVIGRFYSQGGCGKFVPDRCRRRARNRAHNAMKEHYENNNPHLFQNSGISHYIVLNPKSHIKNEIHDMWEFLGGKLPRKINVIIESYTWGKGGCYLAQKLGEMNVDTSKFTFTKNEKIRLFRNKIDEKNNNPYLLYNRYGDNSYQGCGRKAVQNALGFFNIKMSQNEIAQYVGGRHWFDSKKIATTPSEIRRGLQKILDLNGYKGKYIATMYHGKEQGDIIKKLRLGRPVIALVNGGKHWVVFVGYKASIFSIDPLYGHFLVANDYRLELRDLYEASLEFGDSQGFLSDIGEIFGSTSYKSGTIIVFEDAK